MAGGCARAGAVSSWATATALALDDVAWLGIEEEVSFRQTFGHHIEELGSVNGAVAVSVDLRPDAGELGLGRGLMAEVAHEIAERLGADGAVAVLVDFGELLLELCGLLLGQLASPQQRTQWEARET